MPDFDPKAFGAKYAAAPAAAPAAMPTIAAPTEGFDPKAFGSKYAPVVDTLQEQHPDFTAADRLIVKNFAANDEAALAYLKKKHPKLDIQLEAGQVKAKAPGEASYRVLDPDNGVLQTLGGLATFQPEAWQDLGDIGYDAAAAVGTGVATGAAGLAGGAATGGTMAIPAAMAAGAGSSAGLEALRQKLGKMFGMDQDYDAGNIIAAGAGGAVSPLLFGTGGNVAGSLGKKIVGEGLDDATKAALQASQRGGLGRVWDGVGKPLLAKAGSAASGVSEDAINALGQNYGKIRQMENSNSPIRDFTTDVTQDLGRRMKGAKSARWDAYTAAVESAGDDGAKVNLQPIVQEFEQAIAKADNLVVEGKGTQATKDTAQALKDEFERLFTYKAPQLDEAGAPMLDEAGAPLFETKKLDFLSPAAAAKLEQDLGVLGQLQKTGPKNMGVGNSFAAAAAPDTKAMATLGRQLKKTLGTETEAVLGEGPLAIRADYGRIANLEKEAKPLLKTPKTAFASLRNADKTPNAAQAELFGELDREFGSKLGEGARTLDAYSVFAKPSQTPIGGGGATSTSRTIPAALVGSGLGYWAGSNQGGEGRGSGVLGGLAGGALGGFAGSPAMIRRLIAMGLKGEKLNQALGFLRSGGAAQALEPMFEPKAHELWNQIK